MTLRPYFFLTANDMKTAVDVLEAVKGKVIASVATAEIQVMKLELDNWTVISSLSSAMTNGRAQVRTNAPQSIHMVVALFAYGRCAVFMSRLRVC